jgi:hypothetical protein
MYIYEIYDCDFILVIILIEEVEQQLNFELLLLRTVFVVQIW